MSDAPAELAAARAALVAAAELRRLPALAQLAGALGYVPAPDDPDDPRRLDPARVPVVLPRVAELLDGPLHHARRLMTVRPDRVITRPGEGGQYPYLCRWDVRRDRDRPSTDAIYLHEVVRDDEPPPHDHPWGSAALVLRGCLEERVLRRDGSWLVLEHAPGDVVIRAPRVVHMLRIPDRTSVDRPLTLLATGGRCRDWGFHPAGEGGGG